MLDGRFRSKLQRDQDRDISELIALGVPNPRSSSEAQYDQRLFNQSKVRNNHTSLPGRSLAHWIIYHRTSFPQIILLLK